MTDFALLGYQVETAQVLKGEKALDQLTVSTLDADRASKKLGVSSAQSAAQIRRGTAQVKGMGQAMRGSTMQTANLAAQFNDIGVMLAAGQSPLQLALQQGTQINQVFTQMGGGRQALKGLGAAAMSIVNPMSLATIGIIAGGAALTQWALKAFRAGEATGTFAERLEKTDELMNAYERAASDASLSTAELAENFGDVNEKFREALDLIADIADGRAQRSIDGLASSISELLSIRGAGDTRTGVADFFDVGILFAINDAQRAARLEARLLTAEFVNAQAELSAAEGEINAQIDAMYRLIAVTQTLSDLNGSRSADEEELLGQMADVLKRMELQRGEVQKRKDDAEILADQERLLGEQMTESLTKQTVERIRATREAEKTLSTLQDQAAVQSMIAQFGEDHVSIVRLRAQQERQAFVEATNSRNISEELKEQLIAAYDAARQLAQVDIASGVNSAAEAAERLSERLGISLDLARKIGRAGYGESGNNNGLDSLDPRNPNNSRPIFDGEVNTTVQGDSDEYERSLRQRSGGSNPFENNLQSLLQSFDTEREALERWHAESEAMLMDRRALELLGEEEHKEALLNLDREYYARQAELAQSAAEIEVGARRNAVSAIGDLLGTFAGESRAAAIAQIAINKGLAVAQAVQNTAVAQTRALAELGPLAGPPAAARIAAFGRVQIGAILASGLAQAASVGSGGASGGSGGSVSATGRAEPSPQRVLLDFNGAPDWIAGMFEDITQRIQEGSDTGVIYEVAR